MEQNHRKIGHRILTPNRHVIAIFTFIVLLPLVHYIPPWLLLNVTDDHFYVTILALLIIVPIISYVAIPALFRGYEIVNDSQKQNIEYM